MYNTATSCKGQDYNPEMPFGLILKFLNTIFKGRYLPWWLSWLDCGALINVDAPGCGMLVVRGPTGHK